MIAQALNEESWNLLARAKLLPAAVQIAVAVDDLMTAKEAAAELDTIAARYRTDGIEASVSTARGRVQLAEGDAPAAASTLRRAVQQWQALDAPYEDATARVLLAIAARESGDDEGAAACFAAAARTFERLGAVADLVLARQMQGGGAPAAGGLTAREVEVLRLVAAGATNRLVAAELFLSEKTVDRHLSNVFRKLGVSSRAAAAAFAVENGLTGGVAPATG
jgi:DNA-binding NarL/FixJ family response regulator